MLQNVSSSSLFNINIKHALKLNLGSILNTRNFCFFPKSLTKLQKTTCVTHADECEKKAWIIELKFPQRRLGIFWHDEDYGDYELIFIYHCEFFIAASLKLFFTLFYASWYARLMLLMRTNFKVSINAFERP